MTVKVKYEVGDFVRVIDNTSDHKFNFGDIVMVRTLDCQGEIDSCSGMGDYWYLGNDEVEALNDAQ